MRHSFKWAIAIGALGFAASECWATVLVGRVVGVLDGDTVDLLTPSKQQVRVRLAGIDAPERKQAFGNVAKTTLSELVFSREVTVDWHKKDRYGRLIGKVLFNGFDVDLKMVEVGMAWHYKKYAKEQSAADRKLYADAERLARAKGVGLWGDVNPIPPWSFRRPNANVEELVGAATPTHSDTVPLGWNRFAAIDCRHARSVYALGGLNGLDSQPLSTTARMGLLYDARLESTNRRLRTVRRLVTGRARQESNLTLSGSCLNAHPRGDEYRT